MKFKTTRKDILNHYSKVFCVGYCDLYDFLKGFNDPIAYGCGVYGWNYDLYVIEGVAITTGYRSLVGAPLPKDFYNLYKRYQKAIEKLNNSNGSYSEVWKKREATKKRYYNKFIKMLVEL